ncbi:hypothetical protein FKM82_012132 [Ascaphus truei]
MATSRFSCRESRSLVTGSSEVSSHPVLSVFELEKLLYSGRAKWHHADEVWPGLYLGDQEIAANKSELSQMHITHILNASHSRWRTGEEYYKEMNISYLGIEAQDSPTFDMSIHFCPAADFIHAALKMKRGTIQGAFKRTSHPKGSTNDTRSLKVGGMEISTATMEKVI